MAIFILCQQNKLKLTDNIHKYRINIPNNQRITINDLLNHTSCIYDFTSNLYFNLKPKKLFNTILSKTYTNFINLEGYLENIRMNTPMNQDLNINKKFKYNNTGYDILGYIIYIVSGNSTQEFIKNNIFLPLKMYDSVFHSDFDLDESVPYEESNKVGIKEQQNYYCTNGNISCTLNDYNKFLNNYHNLLNTSFLHEYNKLYFFKNEIINGVKYNILSHCGSGDFNYLHSKNLEKYNGLSKTFIKKIENEVNIIVSQNYMGSEPLLSDNIEDSYYLKEIIHKYM